MLLVYLVGMMGAGKTTVAPILAQKLSYNFFDTDLEVEKFTKKSCQEIVDEIGVDGFRSLETQILSKLSSCSNAVIACGGGIVTRPENWRYLQQKRAIVIWLDLPIEEIHRRIKNELRPNLKGLNSEELMLKLREIFAHRQHLYEESNLHIVLDGRESPQEIATQIQYELNDKFKNLSIG